MMMDEPLPPMLSAKGAARRAQIAAAASRYIIEHGYDNLSVNELANEVGISIGGMYRYIKTKSDLLVMVCQDIYDDMRDQLGGIAADSGPVEFKFPAAIDLYLREVDKKRAQVAMMYREYRSLPMDAQLLYKQSETAIADVFVDLIGAGIRRGSFAPVNARVLAFDIVFLGHMPAFKWWALRDSVLSDEVRREQVALVMSRVQNKQRFAFSHDSQLEADLQDDRDEFMNIKKSEREQKGTDT